MSQRKQAAGEGQEVGLAHLIEGRLRDYFAAHEEGALPISGLYTRIVQEVERPLLSMTMASCDGNQLRAAALLGLNRNTLRKKLRDLGLMHVAPTRRGRERA